MHLRSLNLLFLRLVARVLNLASNVIDACIAMTNGWDGFATSMANAMIDAVNFVIKAWNKLVDFLPETIVAKLGLSKGSEIAHRTSITSDLINAKAGLQGLLGEAPSDYWSASKAQYMSLGGAWDKGYNWGSNLEDKIPFKVKFKACPKKLIHKQLYK